MRTVRGMLVSGCVSVWLTLAASVSSATVIGYRATDLADTVPGEDRWQYEYLVSGFAFQPFYGFDIFFPVWDGFLFGDLQDPVPAPNPDWAPITIQADPLLPHDGFYEGDALVANASLSDFFTVEFTWRGTGTPGSQRFEIFNDAFQVIETGRTVPLRAQAVPEPPVASLFAVLLIGVVLVASRITTHPDTPWMIQMARQLTDCENGILLGKRYLILDRNMKYCSASRDFMKREGIEVIRLPPHSPNLNAYAEGWVRGVREECRSRLVPIGQGMLRHTLREYGAHFHHERNHQGLDNQLVVPLAASTDRKGRLVYRPRLGGLLNYYERAAA